MAYLSGNAIYIRYLKGEGSTSLCGSLLLRNNTFERNTGLKIHNGGAVSVTCKYLSYSTDSNHDDFWSTSAIADQSVVEDIVSKYGIEHSQSEASHVFSGNTFIDNYSGGKGTAIYTN
jgi:hypothetical protein